jgi:hypothetical protein
MNARKLTLTILTTMIGALTFASTPALAKQVHVFSSSFGSEGLGPGQFKEPSAVAVNDATGDVYVVDKGNNRVQKFDSTGTTVLAEFNGASAPTGVFFEPEAIAVDNSGSGLDPSKEDVYVADVGHNVIDKFSPSGTYLGQIAAGEGGAALEELVGVAVDPDGVVWADQHGFQITAFSDEEPNKFLSSRESQAEGGLHPGFAVDSEDNLYVDHLFNHVVAKLNSAGAVVTPPGQELGGEGKTGVAVNLSNNDVYLDNGETLSQFTVNGSPIETFGSGHLSEGKGLAVDYSTETVYVADGSADMVRVFTTVPLPGAVTGAVTNLFQSEGSATLNGTLNPAGIVVTSCQFEYGTSTSYGQTAPCVPEAAAIPADSSEHAVSANLIGLTPDTVYHYRLVAGNKNGENQGEDHLLTAPAQPVIERESFSNVGSTAARVSAQINPGGAPTTYHVEYGTSEHYGSSTPEVSVGGGLEAANAQVQLSALQPGTPYHFRFVASNALGTKVGVDVPFTTNAAAGASASTLPDNRAYELVSSPSNNQNVFSPTLPERIEEDFPADRPFQVSPDGNAVAYLGEPPTNPAVEGGNGAINNGSGNQYLATRGPQAWTASDIQPPQAGLGLAYNAFSSDLSVGILKTAYAEGPNEEGLQIPSASPTAPAGCGIKLYSRISGDGSYHALFSTTFTTRANPLFDCGFEEVLPAGISANDSHVIFQTQARLLSEGSEVVEYPIYGGAAFTYNLYDSVGGQLHMINVLPDGKPEPNPDAMFGSPTLSVTNPPKVEPDVSNAVSADGSRIFWSAVEPTLLGGTMTALYSPKALYVRENDTQPQSPIGPKGECIVPADACTVQVDRAQPGATGSSGGGRFWTATSDGSKVFFTDCSRLTEGSTAVSSGGCATGNGFQEGSPTGNDLYEYDVGNGRLTDLTVDANASDPLGADVQGVVGASQDGAYVYFVASGALAPGATPRKCEPAHEHPGETPSEREHTIKEGEEEEHALLPAVYGCNLYVRHAGEQNKFIEALAPKDNGFGTLYGNGAEGLGDWRGPLGNRTAEVTPNGRTVAFLSRLRLTGYDNRLQTGPEPFAYRALSEVFVYDAVSGGLSCASCDSSGTSPTTQVGETQVPVSGHVAYMPRWLSADGSRVFFNTAQPLVPQDANGRQDVYEWERDGAGSCGQSGGCSYALSGGSSPSDSILVDTSENGDDVFFTHRGPLVPQGHNENYALYDARVNGGFPESSLACTGAGCQGVPPAPPIFATPSSVTFNGVGNFPPSASAEPKPKPAKCKKGYVKKHTKCVKAKAKKKTRAKKAGKRSKRGRK